MFEQAQTKVQQNGRGRGNPSLKKYGALLKNVF
jgi:hypothetical protein